jgi:D-alanyl-D-alanine carboxypeptidase
MPTATDREFAEADEAPQEGGAVIDKPSALPGMTPAAPDEDLTLQKHYIEENLDRYLSFMAANTAYSARLAVSLVNLNADYGFYEAISTVANPSDLLALCNKNHQLPEDYAPEGLRAVKGASRLMRGDAAAAYESMSAALKEETGLGLVVVSAYRDFKYQDNLFKKYSKRDGAAVADTYSARAGHSEHQTGLTADIGQKSPSSGMTSLKFQNTPQYEWLLENAHKYGYILRYPKGYEAVTGYMFEPWHWRFIGVGDATAMYEGGYTTFEEYIGEFTPGEVNE